MNAPPPRPRVARWMRSAGLRIRAHWVLKMFGTMLGIGGFFILYFQLMPGAGDLAVVIPALPPDHWIPVSDLALLPYASLWLYVSLGPALIGTLAGLRAYTLQAAVIAAIGLATYWLFPTTTPAMDWSAFPGLQALKATDRGGNAFPSLHVAFAAFTAVVMARELRSLGAPPWLRAANWCWCAAIVYSTLATRQHVLIDVLGGLLLTWAVLHALRGAEAGRRRATAVPREAG